MAKIGENEVVRWFCYLGFAVCSLLLVAGLTFDGRWVAALVGVVVYGVPALAMYRAEQAKRENVSVAAAAAQGRSTSGGRGRFVGLDGEDQ
jgi:hypothetical protein